MEDIPEGVFEAVVGRSGENKVGPPELLDVTEPLELRRVDDSDEQRVHLHVAVDGIVEHLEDTSS